MRRARRRVGSALLAVAAVVALAPVGADAGTLARAGWWWRANDGSTPATLPAPPTVPEGGLMVAGAPDGATAIAALHFDLGDDESSPVLTLQVADNGDQGGDTAILAACVTGSAWEPASAGTWTYKPFPACAQGSVNGVRSDDHASWTFALAPLVSDGIVDVTLVPGIDPSRPDGANGSTFQLSFEAPSGASLATSSGGGPTPDFTVPEFGTPDAAFGGATDFEAPSGGDLALPPVDASTAFTPALPESDQGLTATAPVVQGRNRPLAAAPAASVADHRGLAALVLAICGAVLLWSAQLPVPAPRRLGRFGSAGAEARVDDAPMGPAGLGRFARVRSGSAPRL
ncbi:MAG: hypothetical protein ACT4OV_06380 [Microthrixaceae bacterium]